MFGAIEFRDWLATDPHGFQRMHRRRNQLIRAGARFRAALPIPGKTPSHAADARFAMLNAARKHARAELAEALERERVRVALADAEAEGDGEVVRDDVLRTDCLP